MCYITFSSGEVRNDLYVTLDCADFERGNKKSQKNVEVVVKIFDKNGSQIKVCMGKIN